MEVRGGNEETEKRSDRDIERGEREKKREIERERERDIERGERERKRQRERKRHERKIVR